MGSDQRKIDEGTSKGGPLSLRIRFTSFFLGVLITFSLFSLAFYSFSQTSVFSALVESLELFCYRTAFLRGLETVFPLLLILSVYGLVLVMGAFGGKLNFVYYLSLLLYFPSAFAFSDIDWLELVGSSLVVRSFLSFEQVLFVGLALISCRIFLVNLFQANETKKEFLKRGESEVDGLVHKTISYGSGVLGLSIVIGVLGMFVLIIAGPVVSELLSGVPYPLLLFGFGSSFALILFLYYYLYRESILNG